MGMSYNNNGYYCPNYNKYLVTLHVDGYADILWVIEFDCTYY